jgi:signal transduction histidine kinase
MGKELHKDGYRAARVKAGKRVGVLFYLLTTYIVLQFAWWAYMLVDLNKSLYANADEGVLRMRILMVVGEGAVFMAFLLAGIYIMQRTIRKELALVKQQRNFLLSITHELKTPIAAMKLALQTLTKHTGLPAEKREPLQQKALENNQRLEQLIENVLLATRIENDAQLMTYADTHLATLVHRAVQRIAAAHPDAAMRIHSRADEHLRAHTDAVALEAIVTNLLENAIKYGEGSPVELSLARKEKWLVLQVSDSGPGIPQAEKAAVFAKFYRMGNEETRSKKGTGLGLYLVKELVHMLGGTIALRDNQPTGATFEVLIPA